MLRRRWVLLLLLLCYFIQECCRRWSAWCVECWMLNGGFWILVLAPWLGWHSDASSSTWNYFGSGSCHVEDGWWRPWTLPLTTWNFRISITAAVAATTAQLFHRSVHYLHHTIGAPASIAHHTIAVDVLALWYGSRRAKCHFTLAFRFFENRWVFQSMLSLI